MNRRLSDRGIQGLRLYIGGNAFFAWYNAIGEIRSLLGQTASRVDGGLAILWAMAFLGFCLILDVFINDVMPEKYKWQKAFRQRHVLLSALGVCWIALPFISSMANKAFPLTSNCIWHASIICLALFIDAKKRQRELECATVHS